MTVTAPADAGGGRRSRRSPAWWPAVPAVLVVVAAAALVLPWWRAASGPLLLGAGPLRELTADSWTGFEVTGLRAVLVVALAVVAAAGLFVSGRPGGGTGTRGATAAAGAAAATCGAAALVSWGPTAAPGAWLAVAAGTAAVGLALARAARAGIVLGVAAAVAVATVAVPEGEPLPDRTTTGPFELVTDVRAGMVRSGSAGLSGDAATRRPVLADGAPGIVSASGVVVADARGRARVLARTETGAPPPLGVAADRLVRWIAADTLAVADLLPEGPLSVVVHDVRTASPVGDDGSVWLTSDLDPSDTVRRLDLTAYEGRQVLSATWLPVVTVRKPDGEGPIDVREVRPVPGGALRLAYPDAGKQLQLLTGTATGIAVRPLVPCGTGEVGVGEVAVTAADATGVWFPTPDRRLAHRDPTGVVRVVTTPLPGPISALAAPGDGSVLFITRDDDRNALWRLSDATAALQYPAPPC